MAHNQVFLQGNHKNPPVSPNGPRDLTTQWPNNKSAISGV